MPDDRPFVVKDLVLTILHTASGGTVSSQMMVQIGEYMGVTDNAIRVALSRLVKRKKIEKDVRGSYRVVLDHSLFSQHLTQWRLGEKRRVAWDGTWITCVLPKPAPAQVLRKKSLRALEILGFQRTDNGLFLRPDNLADDIDTLRKKLVGFGMEDGMVLFVSSEYSAETQEFYETRLWPIKALTRRYQDFCSRLQAVYTAMQKKATQAVLIDALILGHEVTVLLTTDPLLPEEMQAPQPRVELTQLMLEFEVYGKRLWEKTIPGLRLN